MATSQPALVLTRLVAAVGTGSPSFRSSLFSPLPLLRILPASCALALVSFTAAAWRWTARVGARRAGTTAGAGPATELAVVLVGRCWLAVALVIEWVALGEEEEEEVDEDDADAL